MKHFWHLHGRSTEFDYRGVYFQITLNALYTDQPKAVNSFDVISVDSVRGSDTEATDRDDEFSALSNAQQRVAVDRTP